MTHRVRNLLLAAGALASPLCAQPQPSPGPAVAADATRPPSFIPADFDAPLSADGTGFRLVPLGPELVQKDFDAYMSSIEHLQKTFTRSTDWPRTTISPADAMRDMENEQARFRQRRSFAYAVLTPDGSRERGCVYVSPSTVAPYQAVVRLWVTKRDYDAGFDATLYRWVTSWMRTDWPFREVVYPGRSISWQTWDALVAASPSK